MSQALIHAKLGDHDEAVFWTRRTGQLGSGSWFALRNHPWTQALQGDREFQAALRGMRDDLDSVRPEMLDVYETICGPSLVQR
jgi:hypothetical protein